ncbi:MAG: 23S rRNA (pseudouridine(1915)-N(3))-methyltransferase RlmH [Bacteroides sp.]|nr:23S rRNA (pseudouridine(1915)-N(3))-methyltransferase RlmH [Bacteroides sp.]
MEFVLMTVGKTTTPYIVKGIEEYEKRLKHYVPFSIKSLADVRNTRKLTQEQQKEAEGRTILSELQGGDMLVLLDERGEMPTSVEFAGMLEKWMGSGRKRVVFSVGGPYGFSKDVYARADRKLSLSRMTFSHEMVRLFFIEQIYRGMTILRGEPYHHE